MPKMCRITHTSHLFKQTRVLTNTILSYIISENPEHNNINNVIPESWTRVSYLNIRDHCSLTRTFYIRCYKNSSWKGEIFLYIAWHEIKWKCDKLESSLYHISVLEEPWDSKYLLWEKGSSASFLRKHFSILLKKLNIFCVI